MRGLSGRVTAVSRASRHRFSKDPQLQVCLIAGLGIDGDAHAGPRVKHRWDARRDPTRPNLRQVHLLAEEELARLVEAGFAVGPGSLGENITTRGLDLVALPAGTRLRLGAQAVLEVTGLRTPCVLLDRFRPGLMAATSSRDPEGRRILKGGVMSIVLIGGEVGAGDPIAVELPPAPHRDLAPV